MPRNPTRETYGSRTCITCCGEFRPERWDQSYCSNKCAQIVNKFLAGKTLEAAKAIVDQELLCWNCGEARYPNIYLAIIRPWKIIRAPDKIVQDDYVALCSVCKLPVRLGLAMTQHTEEA